jgi:TPR repeat protein
MGIKSLIGSLLVACSLFATSVLAEYQSDSQLFNLATKLANTGNALAQYNLGMMYNNGVGTPKDQAKAFDLFLKATKGGDPLGAFKLACYYEGQAPKAVKSDDVLSFKYYLVAAEAGYSLAQFSIAQKYGAQENIDKALFWFKKSASQGYDDAMSHLFVLYSDPKYGVENKALAYKYLRQALVVADTKHHGEINKLLKKYTKYLTTTEIEELNAEQYQPQPTPVTLRVKRGFGEIYDLAGA